MQRRVYRRLRLTGDALSQSGALPDSYDDNEVLDLLSLVVVVPKSGIRPFKAGCLKIRR